MKNFKWIVGRARESMSLDRDAQAIGNLTVRALSKKLLDHAVGDRVRRLKSHLNMLLTDLLEATSCGKSITGRRATIILSARVGS